MGGVMLPEVTVTPQYKEGGSIHIAPSKKGTFTAEATKHGKSVQAFASQVLAHKENYSPVMIKKANFARNAAHWHKYGGDEDITEDVIYNGGTLPEITISPTYEDKAALQAVRSNIPDKNTRNFLLQLLDTYNTDTPVEKIYPDPRVGGLVKERKVANKASYRRDPNQMAARTSELYRLSGRPRINKEASLSAKLLGLIGLDGGFASGRAHMSPLLNTMYNINTFEDFLAELSHSYNNRQLGFFGQGIHWNGTYSNSAYDRPYSLEHTTHSYTEPLLQTYIESAGIPGYENITPQNINDEIKYQVKTDRKRY